MTHEEFKHFISKLNNPIGLIPLENSKFSSCKSAIKFIDYSLCGVVSICSDVPPYSDVVLNDKTGLLVKNDCISWLNAIMKLAMDVDLRNSLSKQAYEFCMQQYTLEHAASIWNSIINSLKITHTPHVQSFSEYKRKRKVKTILSYLMEPSTYENGARIFKNEGLYGIAKRLKRVL